MPTLLDLFCGAGGAAMGYYEAGFDVIGVDIDDQPNYPFKFIQADALELSVKYFKKFDGIHASPPCQVYSTMNYLHKSKRPRLIEPIRERIVEAGKPYVIENVESARKYLIRPFKLCGSSFGLRVQRHRLFEVNFPIGAPPKCNHQWQFEYPCFLIYVRGHWFWTGILPIYGEGSRKAKEYWPWAMDCGETWDNCWMTEKELAQAIPPVYTRWIGNYLYKHLQKESKLKMAYA